MGNVWRVNMKMDGIKIYGQKGLFKFCEQENIIGIGWSSPSCTENLEKSVTDIHIVRDYVRAKVIELKWKIRSFSNGTNVIVDRMNIGDYVWTRYDGIYKLAKIVSEPMYMRDNKEYQDYDIGFYRKVEYCKKDFISLFMKASYSTFCVCFMLFIFDKVANGDIAV